MLIEVEWVQYGKDLHRLQTTAPGGLFVILQIHQIGFGRFGRFGRERYRYRVANGPNSFGLSEHGSLDDAKAFAHGLLGLGPRTSRIL